MNEFSWEKLQQLIGKERFTLTEAIKALIDNQEELKFLESDLEHIIAILFKFEVKADNTLIFTTFTGILRPKDLSEARQIIKEYKQPVTVTNNKYDFYFLDEYVETFEGKVIGVDKAKEGGDSTVMHLKNVGAKLPLFLRNPKKND